MKTTLAIAALLFAASVIAQAQAESTRLTPKFAAAAQRAVLAIRDIAFARGESEFALALNEARIRKADAEAEIKTSDDKRITDEVLPEFFYSISKIGLTARASERNEMFYFILSDSGREIQSCTEALNAILKTGVYSGPPECFHWAESDKDYRRWTVKKTK